jgi:N6-adenosine-specific RNA methylase IME4
MGKGGRRRQATELAYASRLMTTDQIAALPVDDLAEDRAHLYLWSTRRAFREGDAVQVARAWGFEPVGELIWGLRNPGMGSGLLLNAHEPILLASRGSLPFESIDGAPGGVYFWRQVYEYGPSGVPQKVHSAKPPALQDLAEQVSPAPRVELFARTARLGWDSWGDESLGTAELPEVAALAHQPTEEENR